MQYYYSYDILTNEYVGKSVADINPEATKREGKTVYWAPAYATLKKPPTLEKHKVAIFENDTWVVKDDYRGKFVCDENLNITKVSAIGSLPDGCFIITDKQAKQIENDYLWYVVENNTLVKNPKYEELKKQQHSDYVLRLEMSKLDFFNHVCKPNNVSYADLCKLSQENDDFAATWDFCLNVSRGNKTILDNIKGILPDITDEKLDEIFERYGKIINE